MSDQPPNEPDTTAIVPPASELRKNENGQPRNSDKLAELLTFDPGKGVPLAGKAFGRVVREIKREKVEAAKKQAKDLLIKAMDLQRQMTDAKRTFERQEKKFNKELGRVLTQIDNLLKGRPANHGQENDGQQKKEDGGGNDSE